MKRKRKYLNHLWLVAGLIILLLSVCADVMLHAQEPDPFYMKLLEKGKRAFLAQDYEEAARKLEIAAFGLYNHKEMITQTNAYLALSHYRLRNMEKSKQHLEKVKALLGEEGFDGLELEEGAWPDMEDIVALFKMGIIPKREKRLIEQGTIEELEEMIGKYPMKTDYYYALYDRHRLQNDLKAAKQTINNMLEKNPNEVMGYLVLAKMDYRVRRFKNAEKNLEKILKLSANPQAQVEIDLSPEAESLLILCAEGRGKRKKARSLFAKKAAILTEEKINNLNLLDKEIKALLNIRAAYLQTAVKKNP